MKNLAGILTVKIYVTICLWCIPLLLFPICLFRQLGFDVGDGQAIFLRLLGMAYVALVVGYFAARQAAREDRYPGSSVWVGIVSNGGACLLLVMYGLSGAFGAWGALGRAAMCAFAVVTGALTAGLVWFGPYTFGVRGQGSA